MLNRATQRCSAPFSRPFDCQQRLKCGKHGEETTNNADAMCRGQAAADRKGKRKAEDEAKSDPIIIALDQDNFYVCPWLCLIYAAN